jgi:hypothetical protein
LNNARRAFARFPRASQLSEATRMSLFRQFNEDEAVAVAQSALARAFGKPPLISGIGRLGDEERRNLVLRAQALIGDEARAIIIKATRARDYAPSSPDAFAASGLVEEWAARALLQQSGAQRPSPFLAGDAEHGLIVFEDLGPN